MQTMADYSSSDDGFEDLQVLLESLPRIRHFRDRTTPFTVYDEAEFKLRYRFSKTVVRDILELIGHELYHTTSRNMPVDALNQLLLTLRYYATGNFQMTSGDLLNVHQTTAGRIVHKVTRALARLRPQFVKMPNSSAEIASIKEGFFSIAGFPGVLAAVDGSLIRIQSPGGNISETYRCRKGFFAINIQAACDSNLKFMDVVARWPGSCHDSTIFDSSSLRAQLEMGQYGAAYVLGDNGYACRRYLLTPILSPQSSSQQRYNFAQIQTRNTVERAFGVLKSRFPCLSVGMRISLPRIRTVLVATGVLHNMAIAYRDEEPLTDPSVVIPAEIDVPEPIIDESSPLNNFAVRNALLSTVFQ